MEIDGCEVEVRSVEVEGTPLVLVVQWSDQTLLSLFMSRAEAMDLGGLLIGMGTAGVPPRKFSHDEKRQKALDFIAAHPPVPICDWCGREHQPHCTGMMG